MSEAFLTLHRDLPREGPGTAEDVLWALDCAGTPADARICDAACGPGADRVTLAEVLPLARIEAIDAQPHFVEAARARTVRHGARVTVTVGDMAAIRGPYDLIWCAGALYFLGVTEGLRLWRGALAPGGRVAFSEPVFTTTPPSATARAFWAEYPAATDLAGIHARTEAARYRCLGHRLIIGPPWADYYLPQEARIAKLRAAEPGPGLAEVLDAASREIALWRAAPEEIAYAHLVVEPV